MAFRTKIGDIFQVDIESGYKYFQYVAFDKFLLGTNVIRVFRKTYGKDSLPNLSELVDGEVDFYTHCIINMGLKLGFWLKIGNFQSVGKTDILFGTASDAPRKLDATPVKFSEKWHLWRVGDSKYTFVGKLEGENKSAEVGLVFSPHNIVHRIRFGNYLMDYPT